jgi:hypothetical protein
MNLLKKLSFLIVLFLCIAGSAVAQDVTMKWGDIAKRKSRWTEALYIIGRDAKGYYVVSGKTHGADEVNLERYNNENDLEWTSELVIPTSDGKKVKFEKIIYLDGKLLLFTSYYDKKKDKNLAFVNTITADGKVSKDMKEIDFIASEKKMNSGSFDFILSHDSANVLIYHNEPYEKNAQDRFSLKVLDSDLEITWKKDIKVPYRDKDFNISNYIVSNDGRVYMLAKIQEGKRDKKAGRPNYKYTVLSYGEDDKKPREYIISLGDKFISDITFELNKENNLVCAGFYSKNNSAGIAGTFYLTINSEDEKVISKSVKDFDSKILGQFMSERKARKKKELYNYELRKLIPKADGGSILVGEQFYIRVVTTTDPKTGVTTTTYYYYYNDIILVDINKNGEIGWVTRVPKYQVSTNDGGFYSSFAMNVYKDKICLVYNDNRKNITKPGKIRPMTKLKKATAVLVVVDAKSGEYTKNPLFDLKEKDAYLKPKLYLQTAPDELVIYAKKRKNFMFGTLKFN